MLNLNKENLHHAYLLEGEREEIFPYIFKFLDEIGISILNNPDFYSISLDSFKIDDARRLKEISQEKSFSGSKRIFLVSFNSINTEAQNSLLKLFEEPIFNTHFFIITNDVSLLIPTFRSRFYFVNLSVTKEKANKEALAFLEMSPIARLDFLKKFLKKDSDEDEYQGGVDIDADLILSTKTRASQFLNQLEHALFVQKKTTSAFDKKSIEIFKKIFFIRKMLNEQGGSPKTLLEALALEI